MKDPEKKMIKHTLSIKAFQHNFSLFLSYMLKFVLPDYDVFSRVAIA